MSGFIAMQGCLSDLSYLVGQSTPLAAEWAAKTAAGDPNPMTTYLMLLSAAPTDSGSDMGTLAGIEVTGTGYARQPVSWASPVSTTRSIANGLLTQFGPFTDASGLNLPVMGAALVTRATGTSGISLMLWSLASGLTTAQNQVLQVAAGNLVMTLATS
jgi:hypothetical protein